MDCHAPGQGEDNEPDDHAAEHYEEPATASGYVAEPVEAAPVEAEESEEEDMANVRWTNISGVGGDNPHQLQEKLEL